MVPVAGGGFRSRLGVYGPAGSPANLQDWNTINGTLSASRARNYTRRSALKGNPLFASSLNISQSVDRTSTREAQKIRDDWSEFKRSLSRPTTPSTIAPDAETLNGSLSAYPSNQLIQSAYSFGTFPSRQRGNSLSSFIDSNLQKSQQSLISVDLDRPSGTAIMNVILEKVATETYGMKFVEGQVSWAEDNSFLDGCRSNFRSIDIIFVSDDAIRSTWSLREINHSRYGSFQG